MAWKILNLSLFQEKSKSIYLGKVSRVEASLQAAFVEIGSKEWILAFGEVHPNYFQIPVADRDALIKAEAEIEEDHYEETEMKDEISVNNDSSIEKNNMDFVIDEAEIQSHDEEDRNSNLKNNNINKSFKRVLI